jgi:hypothetical protein
LAGIFFGFHAGEPYNGQRVWTCQVIWSKFQHDQTLSVMREQLTFTELRDGNFSLNTVGLGNVPVGRALPQDTILEVIVKAGRVSEVRWDGRPIKDICDPPPRAQGDVPDTTGKFGIINRRGTVTFGNARFMKLSLEKNDEASP